MQLFNSPSPVVDGSAAPTTPPVVAPATAIVAPAVAPTIVAPVVVAPTIAAPANVTSVTATPSIAGLDVDTDVDPFVLDDTMDTRPDVCSPNASFAHVPNPANFAVPSSPEAPHYCITAGQPVGVVENFDSIDIASQERFEFRQFTTWYGAAGYYAVNFHRQQILLIPSATQGSAPPHTRLALEAPAPPIQTAGQGSTASLPVNATSPLAAANVQNVAQGSTATSSPTSALAAPGVLNAQSIAQVSMSVLASATTSAPAAVAASVPPLSVSTALQAPPTQGTNQTSSPTPALGSASNPIRLDSPSSLLLRILDSLDAAPSLLSGTSNQSNSAKGKSSAQNQAPLHEKPRPKVSAATRIRRKGKETANTRTIIIHDTESETDPEILAKGTSSSNAARKQEPAKPKIIVRSTDSDTDGVPSYPKAASGNPSSSNAALTAVAFPSDDVFSPSYQPQSSSSLRRPDVTADSDSSDERYLAARAAIKRSKRVQARRKNTKRSKTSLVRPPTGTTPAEHAGLSTSTTTEPVTEPSTISSRGQPAHPPPSSATHRPAPQSSILPAKLDIFSLQSPFNQMRGPEFRFPRTPNAAATSGTNSHSIDSSPIPATSPLLPHPDEKRFVPLFSDLDGDQGLDGRDEVSPWFAQWLRTNAGKRYRANAVARRLFCDQPTADGNFALTVSDAVATTSANGSANATAPTPANINTIAPTPVSTEVNTITTASVDVDVNVNTSAPANISTEPNTITPAPVDVDVNTIVPSPISTDVSTIAPASVSADVNTIAPSNVSANGSSTVSSPADMSNEASENDGRDAENEVRSPDYGFPEMDVDFLEEIGPFLDIVYVPPAVEDAPVTDASQVDK